MKYVSGTYDPETGISEVVFADKRGRYIGRAKLHPDDRYSEFAGLHIAEDRAWLKYYISERRRIKERLNAIQSLKKELQKYTDYDRKTERRINLAIRDYSNDIENLTAGIKELKRIINDYLVLREKIVNSKK